jgi:hypothetical protein
MIQAMLIDEVLPKGMVVYDYVIAQRMLAEGRPDNFMDMAVYVNS